jgi:hypothetical protein
MKIQLWVGIGLIAFGLLSSDLDPESAWILGPCMLGSFLVGLAVESFLREDSAKGVEGMLRARRRREALWWDIKSFVRKRLGRS